MLVSFSYRKLGMQSLIEGLSFHIERLDSNPLLKIERLKQHTDSHSIKRRVCGQMNEYGNFKPEDL